MHPIDLVESDADGMALEAPPREYTRRQFLTNVWKTGNFLRSLGVHEDSLVAVLDEPTLESLLSFFGASLLDARIRFESPAAIDARVAVGPTEELQRVELPPGGQYVGYESEPEDPSWTYFERDVWSENPTFPEVDHDRSASLIETEHEQYDTESIVQAARSVVAAYEPDDRVALRSPLAMPETVVAGVLAPIAADATILLPGDDETGTVAVTSGDAPESRIVDPKRVELSPRSL